jgi:hypothetical protein
MPGVKHFYAENHLRYVTASASRKPRVFDSDPCKRKCIQTLPELRTELSFRYYWLEDRTVLAMDRMP